MSKQDLPELPIRDQNAHKGMFGHALLIGGAVGMTGAISIAGLACLRTGAGLVTIAVPQCSQGIVASFDPHYMTLQLPCDSKGLLMSSAAKIIENHLERITCVAIGPGLGRSEPSDAIVVDLFKKFDLPMIVDADGLNALSVSEIWKSFLREEVSPIKALRILTPHPGEWERLSGVSAGDRGGQIDAAHQIAARTGCIVLLKGNRTLITDGRVSFVNESGNSSMAVGGNGDCLTGIISALVCQGMSGMDAARLGAHLHGLAGDLAHAELGTPSTLATDLIRYLPAAFRSLNRGNKSEIGFNLSRDRK